MYKNMFYGPGICEYICNVKERKNCTLKLYTMKTITSRLLQLSAAFILFFSAKTNAQCGIPPSAAPGTISCYGGTTNVTVALGLLGGPYNIQPFIDYQFPGIPFAAYSTNDPGPSYTLTNQTAGTYTVYVIDVGHGNCYDSAVYTLTEPAILNFANLFASPTTCSGMIQASYTMAGGTPPYNITYSNDSVNYSTLTTTSATTYTTTLALGAYAYKLIDANGCMVDQSATVFGSAATDQAHWYIGLCGVEDSAVEYLTGGNQSISRNVNLLMLGLGNFDDVLDLAVDYGDNSGVQNFSRQVKNESSAIALNHTYSGFGVYKVTYTAYNSNSGLFDSVQVVEFINNNADVYPGDANGDGVANNMDLLNVGMGFGTTGVVRPGANLSWTAQACADWTQFFGTGENYKHADCDGDGTINYSDTTAIVLNYGSSHVLKMSTQPTTFFNPNDPTLTIDFPAGNFSVGTPVSIPVSLGTSTVPANNVYGIAFTVNYPSSAVDPNSINVNFAGSWLGTVGTSAVAIEKNFSGTSSVDIAISRNDQTNVSGFGQVCAVDAITIDNVSGKMLTANEYITLSNVRLIDKDGNAIAVNVQKDSLTVNGPNGINSVAKPALISVYPNPAKEILNISSAITIEGIMITDISGRVVQNLPGGASFVQVKTNELEAGVYFVKIRTARGTECKTIEISK
jgi:hypothetical protein